MKTAIGWVALFLPATSAHNPRFGSSLWPVLPRHGCLHQACILQGHITELQMASAGWSINTAGMATYERDSWVRKIAAAIISRRWRVLKMTAMSAPRSPTLNHGFRLAGAYMHGAGHFVGMSGRWLEEGQVS
ncbi:hypothetical protein ACWGS9_15400 [Bradyrhizobium sp. Arg314]